MTRNDFEHSKDTQIKNAGYRPNRHLRENKFGGFRQSQNKR
jgi:hypothetical protein